QRPNVQYRDSLCPADGELTAVLKEVRAVRAADAERGGREKLPGREVPAVEERGAVGTVGAHQVVRVEQRPSVGGDEEPGHAPRGDVQPLRVEVQHTQPA